MTATRQRALGSPRRRGSWWRGARVPVPVLVVVATVLAGCQDAESIPAAERRTIADSLQRLVTQAYDFSRPDVAQRLLSLYPDSGRVISAAAGRITTTRSALQTEITGFWERVGRNMHGPTFTLGSTYVDVITRNAAVMTFSYSIPHHTPAGAPHTVSGAWTTLWRRQDGRWRIVQEHLSDTPESTAPSNPSRRDSAGGPPGADGRSMSGMPMPGGGRN